MLRIGIVGAARVASYAMLAPAKTVERARVISVAARDPLRAAGFATQHGIEQHHASYGELLGDPGFDLIYIPTPPATHAVLAHEAIRAGKHILVEKPFALNAVEGAAILSHAKQRGVRAFEAIHALHHPLFAAIREVVRNGSLGEIRRVKAHFQTVIAHSPAEFRWNSRLGGGALMDLGVYPLAFCRQLFGESFDVRQVAVEQWNGVDAKVRAELAFGDVAAEISCSMIEPSDAGLEIEGTKGVLKASNPVAPSLGNRLQLYSENCTRDEVFSGPSSWHAQLAAIVATLLDGAEFPLPLDDPLHSMAAIDQIRAHPGWKI